MKLRSIITKFVNSPYADKLRYTATSAGGIEMQAPPDTHLTTYSNHQAVAMNLQQRMRWEGILVGGQVDENTMIWTPID